MWLTGWSIYLNGPIPPVSQKRVTGDGSTASTQCLTSHAQDAFSDASNVQKVVAHQSAQFCGPVDWPRCGVMSEL